ncbi:unnamed protein product [Caenorhabditis angaria]|uniref:Uncharacterized protein n=1 Tax=Caenorhabditis angaria TaxID=860376 RepID=A0A9P1IXX6_9PELO|nr:unnamed protein product [Caenorhabditis angaria]
MNIKSFIFCSFLLIFAKADLLSDIQDALFRANSTVNERIPMEITVDDNILQNSQKANEASKMLQANAEIFEEATQILVQKFGMGIIPIANKVLETTQMLNNTIRVKRDAKCPSPPSSCSDNFHRTTRSISGICNNVKNRKWGNSETGMRRLLGAVSYSDGLNTIRTRGVNGKLLPSAREISNKIFQASNENATSKQYNHLLMQMGQFLAHDLIFMPSSTARSYGGGSLNCSSCDSPKTVSPNCAPIPVPSDDPYFKIGCIRLTRALNGQTGFGIRQQIDQNTHFIDLSAVYGSEDCEAVTVREYKDGRLLEFRYANYVLPPQNVRDENCQSRSPFHCFTCGDFRNSLHPALIPIHTVFIKQHNRLAQMIKNSRSGLTDEQIFQLARRIMIAQWQHFVYSEYLPNILSLAIRKKYDLVELDNGFYKGYKQTRDPSLTNEFTGAAFRFGHSQARDRFQRINNKGQSQGDYKLGNDIFYADQNYLAGNGGWEAILIGMIKSEAMEVDRYISHSMRNEIFRIRQKEGTGVDLAAVNVMRGRDIGLLPYTSYRKFAGLSAVKSWDGLSQEFTKENIDALKKVYDSYDDIDLYAAILSEKHMGESIVGPTAANIIAETFEGLKVGDRFYYENEGIFTNAQLAEIRKSKLSKIICQNTDGLKTINRDIFSLSSQSVNCDQLADININVFF